MNRSILECFLEILLSYWTNCILLLLHTGLMANIRIRIHHEILGYSYKYLIGYGSITETTFFLIGKP